MSLDNLYYSIRDSMKIQNTDDVVFKLFQNLGVEWENYLQFMERGAKTKKRNRFSPDQKRKYSGKVPCDRCHMYNHIGINMGISQFIRCPRKRTLKRPPSRDWLVVLYTSSNIFPTGGHFRRKSGYMIGAASRTCAKDRFWRTSVSLRARKVRLNDSRRYKRVCTLLVKEEC